MESRDPFSVESVLEASELLINFSFTLQAEKDHYRYFHLLQYLRIPLIDVLVVSYKD